VVNGNLSCSQRDARNPSPRGVYCELPAFELASLLLLGSGLIGWGIFGGRAHRITSGLGARLYASEQGQRSQLTSTQQLVRPRRPEVLSDGASPRGRRDRAEDSETSPMYTGGSRGFRLPHPPSNAASSLPNGRAPWHRPVSFSHFQRPYKCFPVFRKL
jgi:hypothetical protein